MVEFKADWPAQQQRQSVYVYIPDVDAAHAAAVRAGAVSVAVPHAWSARAAGARFTFMTAAARTVRPARRRFSSADVMRMVELGILKPDEPLELIEGELIVVTPQGPLHASRVMALQESLARAYEGLAKLRVQLPLDGRDSLPEPDLAVVRGQASDYAERHPTGTDSLLVVEVAQTSQTFDRNKAAVYARMGVPEYWLLDLERGRLEIRRGPTADGLYTSTEILSDDARAQLPGLEQSIAVGELLG